MLSLTTDEQHPEMKTEGGGLPNEAISNSGAMKDKGQVFTSVCNTKLSDFYSEGTQ